jgi:hypothetical protein
MKQFPWSLKNSASVLGCSHHGACWWSLTSISNHQLSYKTAKIDTKLRHRALELNNFPQILVFDHLQEGIHGIHRKYIQNA